MSSKNSINRARWLAGAVVAAACLAATSGQLVAAPRAGQASGAMAAIDPTRDESSIRGPHRAVALMKADSVRDALGFPSGKRLTASHVHDGFQRLDYDEVNGLDADGRLLWVTQVDASGRLLTAVRLDDRPRSGTSVGRSVAMRSATRAANAAGLPTAGSIRVEQDPASSGWTVHWLRSHAGVPVRGDETRLQVWPDGRVLSASQVVHELARPPAAVLSRGQASAAARQLLDGWMADRPGGLLVEGLDLEWVGPNGAFDPARPLEPDPLYRLAWVVNVRPTGPAADYVRLITAYLDAGDGSLLGGDLVE